MATKVQSKEGRAGSGTSVAVAATVYTAGNSLLVWVGHESPDTTPVLTDTTHSVTFTRVLTKAFGGTSCAISFFYLHAITGGSTVVTLSSVTVGGTIWVQEWSGLQNAAPDVSTSNTGTSASESTGTTATTANAVELITAGACNDLPTSTAVTSVSSGWTLDDTEPDGTSFWPTATAHKETTTTGTQNNIFTWGNVNYAAGIVAFKEAAGGGTTFNVTSSATVTFTASTAKQVAKPLSKAVTFTPTTAKQINKAVAQTVTFTPSTNILKVLLKSVAATVTFSATSAKQVGKAVTGAVTFTPTSQKQAAKNLSQTVTFTPTTAKQVSKTVSKTVTFTASTNVLKVLLKSVSATVTFTASTARQVGKAVAQTVTFTPSTQRRVSKTNSATVTVTPTSQKLISKAFSAAATFTASSVQTLIPFVPTGLPSTIKAYSSAVRKYVAISGAKDRYVAFSSRVARYLGWGDRNR